MRKHPRFEQPLERSLRGVIHASPAPLTVHTPPDRLLRGRDGAHRNSPELLIGIPQVVWSG
ncbi:hypothetical protein ACFPRL_28105 [Pseudoclavibacter helvolus]